MNQIMPSLCALALLAASACPTTTQAACERAVPVRAGCRVLWLTPSGDYYVPPLPRGMGVACCYDAYREPYRISYPRVCIPRTQDLVYTGQTERALAIRRTAVLRQRENVQFERELLAATVPIEQPSRSGTVIFGETEGAGSFESGTQCPPPAPPYPGPTLGSGGIRATVKTVPVPVGEITVLVATPVPGKPGFVYSPYANGYVDVRGFAPGCLAKDPFSGRKFRVP